jgi:hypothetical protein
MEVTPTTELMPIIMPNIVKPVLSLLLQSEFTAIVRTSVTKELFVKDSGKNSFLFFFMSKLRNRIFGIRDKHQTVAIASVPI